MKQPQPQTTTTLYRGDCLEEMNKIPDATIDMILCDPPYGSTACHWDEVIPLKPMWKHLKRVIKPNGAIVMTAGQPFTTTLIASNMEMFKYCWVWIKEAGTGFLNTKKYPLKNHEDVIVFCNKGYHRTYNPQMTKGEPYVCKKGGGTDNYNKDDKTTELLNNEVVTVNKGERYPLTVLEFNRDKNKAHPTQKPVALMECLIKTYTSSHTNNNETVLDFAMGSGTTGVACKNLNRNFIGIEEDWYYFDVAEKRINNT